MDGHATLGLRDRPTTRLWAFHCTGLATSGGRLAIGSRARPGPQHPAPRAHSAGGRSMRDRILTLGWRVFKAVVDALT